MIRKNNRWKFYVGLAVIGAAAAFFLKGETKKPEEAISVARPFTGKISTVITSTATVQPQNGLELKPPINGRIEKILIKEGERVKEGQIIAWMSSTERAALLDAARARGAEAVKYWEEVYKPTPLISPIDGEIIVSTDEPGQTVTASDVIVVLSDHLIVQAQVDETDIGRVCIGQEAVISLDAYPEIKVSGKVDHIYYESKTVNNVTIYQVDIVPETVPAVFRSGMTATVDIIERTKDNALLVPIEAVKRGKDGNYVVLMNGNAKKTSERAVETGIADEKNIEIVSGLSGGEVIAVINRKYTPGNAPSSGSNPFMPFSRKR
ncbi:MAG: HlyD family efflux transporter periplasmic adaptor subunit [Candidatus Omnitrophota bacterium]